MIESYIPLTKTSVLSRISEYEIFRHYVKSFEEIDQFFSSELREDKTPSCRIRPVSGRLVYKDFGETGSLDCFAYVQKLFDVNFNEALKIINNDLNLCLGRGCGNYNGSIMIPQVNTNVYKQKTAESKTLQVRYRGWNKTTDKDFWQPYGITVKVLSHFNTNPIDRLWVDERILLFKEDEQAYEYLFEPKKRKIYRPNSVSTNKWRCNCVGVIEGWEQLPESNDLLIITKSYKDVMVYHTFGIPAIAASSETTFISTEVLEGLKCRFKNIVSNTDFDRTGIKAAKYYKEHGIPAKMLIPSKHGAKDISDFRKKFGLVETQNLINHVRNR